MFQLKSICFVAFERQRRDIFDSLKSMANLDDKKNSAGSFKSSKTLMTFEDCINVLTDAYTNAAKCLKDLGSHATKGMIEAIN